MSDYIGTWYQENPELMWEVLKEKLRAKYDSERTSIEAGRKLFRLRQNSGETPTELGERALRLALQAYPDESVRNCNVIQSQLTDLFVDALDDTSWYARHVTVGIRN